MLKKIISSGNEASTGSKARNPEPEETYSEDYTASPAPTAPAANYGASYSSEPSYSSAPSQMSKNLLSNDVEIKGSIKFSDELILDGTIEGEIHSEVGHLTVGENARVKGEIRTRAVVVFGKVDGNLVVTERCELKADAEIVGDIKAGTLSIEEGAAFMGQSAVGSAAMAKTKTASTGSSTSSSSSGPGASSASGSSSSSGSSAPRQTAGSASSSSPKPVVKSV